MLGNLQSCCGTFDCNPGGLPKAYTGTFTKTFHFETVTGGVAFRSYTRYDDLQRPYSAIAESHQYMHNDVIIFWSASLADREPSLNSTIS